MMHYQSIKDDKDKYRKIIFTEDHFSDAFINSAYDIISKFIEDLGDLVDESAPDLFYNEVVLGDLEILNDNDDLNRLIINKDELTSLATKIGEEYYPNDQLKKTAKAFNLDFQARVKMFEFRYCERYRQDTNYDVFYPFRLVRNAVSGHITLNMDARDQELQEFFGGSTYNNICKKYLKKNNRYIENAICQSVREVDRKTFRRVQQTYAEMLEFINENLQLRLNPQTISPAKTDNIELHEFCGYVAIVADETACIGKYQTFIRKLAEYIEVLPTAATVEVLKDICRNTDEQSKAEREAARDFLNAFLKDNESVGKNAKRITSISRSDNPREEIVEALLQTTEGTPKLCLITESEVCAEAIWKVIDHNLHLQNAIVIRPNSYKTATIFRPVTQDPLPLQVDFQIQEETAGFEKPVSITNNDVEILNIDTPMENADAPSDAPIAEKPYIPESVSKAPTVLKEPRRTSSYKVKMPKKNDTVYLKYFDDDEMIKVKLEKELSSGGEGTIYRNNNTRHLIKIYRDADKAKQEAEKITNMVRYAEEVEKLNHICWPVAEVWDISKRQIIGFAMEEAEDCVSLQDIISDIIEFDEGHYIKNRAQLVNICIKIADRFSELHSITPMTLMGDINLNNIMVCVDKNYKEVGDPDRTEVYFVDVDSYQFGEFLCPVGTPDFTSPSMHQKMAKTHLGYRDIPRTLKDERFATAVLYFYLLMIGEFPFSMSGETTVKSIINGNFAYARDNLQSSRNFAWLNLTDEIRSEFIRCFKEKKYCDDRHWADLFYSMIADIRAKKLSNEIEPMCVLQSPEDEFDTMECLTCGKTIETTRLTKNSDSITKSEQRCQKCIKYRAHRQAVVAKVVCTKCGRIFTVNQYDALQEDRRKLFYGNFELENIVCPDCRTDIKYSRSGEFGDQDKITDTVSKALMNLLS